MNVVGEPIKQGPGESFGAEHLGPLLERQVRGNQSGTTFIALAEHLGEQFGAGLGQWHEAQLIDDQQFVAGDLLLEAEQLPLVAGLDQLADQGCGGGEADTVAALACGQAQSQGDVRLPPQRRRPVAAAVLLQPGFEDARVLRAAGLFGASAASPS